ncbi:bifunctional 4-hydroxy-2-oxoglutarate aldolase/2-dehydro-3-deoxy-phosphogluconate aldolase [Neobacillus novalis]|uniref:Bifunctional 4-hydroxy-2-oxoglutarate aldolase/2-dehydro-3-deoxy-phosphogluconate aldolase n=1 Tax=Neobacillus novalis TaxID=220687 RepID=A0AA95MSD4_9BACI|nr:bifunctional 4-hydroxy-2-oxoglutarate aldolase/2-dehydro-3-deoxy-phosphogluconate aldolase [Neobacillus novalis]WHY88547.1 bifunctional 4-hydroxy-2-oxoglutarate aldolase/2-dehydro-3-deoxy-phosphogluconate aldolase [Neobacillus novalis]
MKKQEVMAKLQGKIIAVIRGNDLEEAKEICKALVHSGITTLEITFSLPKAEELIHTLKSELPEAVIGAGTVLTKEQAELAVSNGADFIVSPCVVEEVGSYCKQHEIFCSLGAATPTEAYRSYLAGSDVVKLFPGECVSMKMIKGIKAPMPFIEMMPTGGVDDSNIKEWFESGAFAVGLGGYLTKGIHVDNLDLLKERCETILHALQ